MTAPDPTPDPDQRPDPSPESLTEPELPAVEEKPDAEEGAHLTVMRRVETAKVPQYGAPAASGARVPRPPVPPPPVPMVPPVPSGAARSAEDRSGPATGKLAALRLRMRQAWQAGRSPELLLPPPGPRPLSIGRAPGSVLRLNDFTVSRAHAQLRSTEDGWTLRDLGSSNGTWVNGRRVTGTTAVHPGDHVRFGHMGFRLVAS